MLVSVYVKISSFCQIQGHHLCENNINRQVNDYVILVLHIQGSKVKTHSNEYKCIEM